MASVCACHERCASACYSVYFALRFICRCGRHVREVRERQHSSILEYTRYSLSVYLSRCGSGTHSSIACFCFCRWQTGYGIDAQSLREWQAGECAPGTGGAYHDKTHTDIQVADTMTKVHTHTHTHTHQYLYLSVCNVNECQGEGLAGSATTLPSDVWKQRLRQRGYFAIGKIPRTTM
jgi:hypothetical protein